MQWDNGVILVESIYMLRLCCTRFKRMVLAMKLLNCNLNLYLACVLILYNLLTRKLQFFSIWKLKFVSRLLLITYNKLITIIHRFLSWVHFLLLSQYIRMVTCFMFTGWLPSGCWKLLEQTCLSILYLFYNFQNIGIIIMSCTVLNKLYDHVLNNHGC